MSSKIKKNNTQPKKITSLKKQSYKEKEMIISSQIKDFLKAGGQITKIPSGTSGKAHLSYRRLMTISEKSFDKPLDYQEKIKTEDPVNDQVKSA